ncbi:MAG: tetratricopeptide repeat protein [Chitinophagaceae bacterium]
MTPLNNISPEDLEQMDDYLSGSMTPEQHTAFNARLQTDPVLQEARLLITGIREASLMEKLGSFHSSATQKTHAIAPKRMRTYWMAAAASVIILAVTAMLLWKSSDDKLAASYFEPDPGLATTMGSVENYAFSRGMVDYKTGKYREAIEAWRPLIAVNPANDTLHYFSGVSYLALHKADSAAHHLLQVWNSKESSFHSDAGWYIALSLLSQGKKTEARSFLEKTSHPKKEELLPRIK